MKKVKKVWGSELWITNSKKYCGKKLFLKRGYRCSIHHHKIKDETFFIIRGRVLMEVGKKKWIMEYGDVQHIEPMCNHRFTGLTDAEIIEFSTQHLESDSYRKTKSEKCSLRKAYDYDGVVSKGIKLEPEAPIITGRSFEELNRIDSKKTKGHVIYFNPVAWGEKTLEKEIEWKAEMIKKLKIEEYYEDDCRIIVTLTEKCPKCNIIKV